MGLFEKPGYQVDRGEPSELFLKARDIAGYRLQAEFEKRRGKVAASRDYRWIKSELTWPSFDHLTLGYGNQVFSVLVTLFDGAESHFSDNERDRFIEATARHNLVPCLFRIQRPEMRPVGDGWNLTHAITGDPVVPEQLATGANILMSEWELRSYATQIVRRQVKEDKESTLLSFCDLLHIDPQIWFEDNSGNRCWVLVRRLSRPAEAAISNWVGLEKANPQMKDYDGFFAGVLITSAAPVSRDAQDDVIPLSERFTGEAPPYRGDDFYINFEGLRRIHVS